MSNHQTISILGCGWLGLPLAKELIRRGYLVKGSTTHKDNLDTLAEHKIDPYLIQFSPQLNADYLPEFFSSDILIVNIPPGRKRENVEHFYAEVNNQLLAVLQYSSIKKVIFISSTSVYPDVNRVVTELDSGGVEGGSGQALVKAEQAFLHAKHFKTTVIRFCGLFGYDRKPGRFFAGKKLPYAGKAPINFIHQDDCVQIICSVLEKDCWNEVFNACADCHPDKQTFYTTAAKEAGLPLPEYSGNEPETFKEINSEKLKKALNYQFIHPDPLKSL